MKSGAPRHSLCYDFARIKRLPGIDQIRKARGLSIS